MTNSLTRRDVSIRFLSLLSIMGFMKQMRAQAADDGGISRTCECIHQEVVIRAAELASTRC